MLRFANDVETWDAIVKQMEDLPFRCMNVLGQGVNCSVLSLCPLEEEGSLDESESGGDWTDEYFGLGDMHEDSESTYSSSAGAESESSSGEWSSADADGSTTKMPHTCLTTQSPMGVVEVVAKKFDNITTDVCYDARRAGSGDRVHIDEDARRYLKWLVAQPEKMDTSIIKKHISPTTAGYSEFVSESLCHILLTDLVVKNITPHVVMAFRALEHENKGYLIQERISSTIVEALEENPKLSCRDMTAMYLQVFVTLHILQDTCGFKHHDLHLDNVFLKRIDDSMVWNGVRMDSATHFSYELDGVTLTIPNCGYIVKLGDFGMSSLDVYGRRIQRLYLNESSSRWGEWTPVLVGRRGYDGQVLVGDLAFDEDSWRFEDEDTRAFLRRLRVAAQGPNGKLTYSKHRPVTGHVSDVPPLDVVQQVFVENPLEVCDFRATPTDAKVMCLGSLANLSTEPVAKPKKRRRRRTSDSRNSLE